MSSPPLTTDAILIRLTRLTETSLIVHWFSLGHGLVKTVAKGARRPNSPFRGRLDLFFGGEITFLPSRRGELHPLREVVIRDWREMLRRDYLTTLAAGYCCQLLESAVEPEHPDPALHDLLRRALDHLETSPATTRAIRHFEAELARILGISHHSRDAGVSLREALGAFPASRDMLMERLSQGPDFLSSEEENRR